MLGSLLFPGRGRKSPRSAGRPARLGNIFQMPTPPTPCFNFVSASASSAFDRVLGAQEKYFSRPLDKRNVTEYTMCNVTLKER